MSPSQPHLAAQARLEPSRQALVFVRSDGSIGATRTFRELDDRSLSLAASLQSHGLSPGDVVAVLAGNVPELLETAWAAQRSGLYVTAINSHLRGTETAHVLRDCGATVVVTTPDFELMVSAVVSADVTVLVTGRGASYEAALSAATVEDRARVPALEGDFMLYSSGTTGLPKGIKRPLPELPLGEPPHALAPMLASLGLGESTTYLCPAPLYHAAPLAWSMAVHRLGGRVVVLESFDPQTALDVIDRESVTHAQFVPTMFVRMLKLSEQGRAAFRGESLQLAVHAAAPCPPDVKRRMIDWWGPKLLEFYSATEGIGMTLITSEEWLTHPGSVGRAAMGTIHVLDDTGREVPSGTIGEIWFSGGAPFEYHGDAAKTSGVVDENGRATVGDVGFVDDDGYLYLTDRADFMIISGGVNVYPQEVENRLIEHPAILDAAVIGAHDEDLGEVPFAFVELVAGAVASPDEIIQWCREVLATIKCPRGVAIVTDLPRTPTGKLRKHELRRRIASD